MMVKAFQPLRAGRALSVLNRALGVAEIPLRALVSNSDVPSLWIIGPPRSGTTLLYQVMVNRYDLTYFSNFTARLYLAPIVGIWLERSLLRKSNRSGEYQSQFGKTPGWLGPSEAGAFWYRWFPKGDHVHVPAGATPEEHLEQLRQEVYGMSKVRSAPTVFKNTYNSMRIAPIVEAFPEAYFLVCRRNPIDTAQSILAGRIRAAGDKHVWWSLPPNQIDKIRGHPPCEQVVEQVYYVYGQIEEDGRRLGSSRFFEVHYEALCNDVQATLSSIEQFLGRKGVKLSVSGQVPDRFPVSRGQKVSDDDYRCIVRTVERLWGGHNG